VVSASGGRGGEDLNDSCGRFLMKKCPKNAEKSHDQGRSGGKRALGLKEENLATIVLGGVSFWR